MVKKLEMEIERYKKAPTFLYNKGGESKLFQTQEEVDAAWEGDWFGPPWMLRDKAPISQTQFETKRVMEETMQSDPRYKGLTLNLSQSKIQCLERITAWEIEHGIIDPPDLEDPEPEASDVDE